METHSTANNTMVYTYIHTYIYIYIYISHDHQVPWYCQETGTECGLEVFILTLRGFSLRYGGSPSIILNSHDAQGPDVHFGPVGLAGHHLGAIQYGVPTMVLRLFCSGVIWAQKPKSADRQRERERDG